MHILRFVLAAAGLWFGIRSFRAARDRPRRVRAVLEFLSDGAWHDSLRVLRACDGREIPSADSYLLLADMEEEGGWSRRGPKRVQMAAMGRGRGITGSAPSADAIWPSVRAIPRRHHRPIRWRPDVSPSDLRRPWRFGAIFLCQKWVPLVLTFAILLDSLPSLEVRS
jgi:hypothetical protein